MNPPIEVLAVLLKTRRVRPADREADAAAEIFALLVQLGDGVLLVGPPLLEIVLEKLDIDDISLFALGQRWQRELVARGGEVRCCASCPCSAGRAV